METKNDFEVCNNTNSGIYMLYNINNHKVYIGKAQNIARRGAWHKANLRQGTHNNQSLQEDFAKGDEFVHVVLEDMGADCYGEELTVREELYILAYLDKNIKLYNCTTRERVEENLWMHIVSPKMHDIQRSLGNAFGIPLPTFSRCNPNKVKAYLAKKQ